MIYEKLKNNLLKEGIVDKKISIAVSGGVDSMVLLHMLAKSASEFNNTIQILTVNHNLRENGIKDAEFVLNYADSQNLDCTILEWKHDGIFSNIQAQARKARYDLLADHCKKQDIDIILTAHHADDQIENFFIKLSRGSSIYSFANNKNGIQNEIIILRPMSDIFRKDIESYAKEHNIPFIEDESNSDSKYLRNEMRKKLNVFLADGEHMTEELFKSRILLSIENISRATKSLENLIERCLQDSFTFYQNKALLNIEKYRSFLQEEQMQALVKILQQVSGNQTNIRLDSIIRLYDAIIQDDPFVLTLHSCIIKRKNDLITIEKEPHSLRR
jgi:tRNA(Ile)-lysidine synthase